MVAFGAGLVDRFLDRIEDRPAFVGGAALAGRHSANDVGAILGAGLGVERAFAAGDALHHRPCGFV